MKETFDQPAKNNIRTNDSIKKIAKSYRDDYSTGYLLAYPYFKNTYKMIAIDLRKQQGLSINPKAIRQRNFTENFYESVSTTIFIFIKESKETIRHFLQGTVRVLQI